TLAVLEIVGFGLIFTWVGIFTACLARGLAARDAHARQAAEADRMASDPTASDPTAPRLDAPAHASERRDLRVCCTGDRDGNASAPVFWAAPASLAWTASRDRAPTCTAAPAFFGSSLTVSSTAVAAASLRPSLFARRRSLAPSTRL